jgi:hypothetical protein
VYKAEEKIYLGVCEQKRLYITGLETSPCITQTVIISQLAQKSEEMGIHDNCHKEFHASSAQYSHEKSGPIPCNFNIISYKHTCTSQHLHTTQKHAV